MTVRRGKKIVKYQPNVTNFGFEKEKKSLVLKDKVICQSIQTVQKLSFTTKMLLRK